jgi:hypothetical protein
VPQFIALVTALGDEGDLVLPIIENSHFGSCNRQELEQFVGSNAVDTQILNSILRRSSPHA